jgi:hypothetical protein
MHVAQIKPIRLGQTGPENTPWGLGARALGAGSEQGA